MDWSRTTRDDHGPREIAAMTFDALWLYRAVVTVRAFGGLLVHEFVFK